MGWCLRVTEFRKVENLGKGLHSLSVVGVGWCTGADQKQVAAVQCLNSKELKKNQNGINGQIPPDVSKEKNCIIGSIY